MSLIVKPNTFTVGAVIIASEHNSNFDTIYSDYNGNITDANIASGAGISDSKLAQITTASKVSGAALTSLSSIPSAAGSIPAANVTAFTLSGGTRGAIANHDGSGWVGLPAGTHGYFLMSSGTSANVSYKNAGLGTWGSAAADGVVVRASTDLFVGYSVSLTASATASLTSDSDNPPTTVRASLANQAGFTQTTFLCTMVKKYDYYKIALSAGSITNGVAIPIGQ